MFSRLTAKLFKFDHDDHYYDMYRHLLHKDLAFSPFFSKVREFIDLQDGAKILDVGCGLGYFLNWISKDGVRGVGVDVDFDVLKKARNLYPRLVFYNESATSLHFDDESFDRIVLLNVIEHIEPKMHKVVLKEIRRVLADGGVFIISTVNKDSVFKRLFINDPTHVKEYGYGEFLSFVQKFFTIASLSYTNNIGRFSHTINELISKLLPCDIVLKCVKKTNDD